MLLFWKRTHKIIEDDLGNNWLKKGILPLKQLGFFGHSDSLGHPASIYGNRIPYSNISYEKNWNLSPTHSANRDKRHTINMRRTANKEQYP